MTEENKWLAVALTVMAAIMIWMWSVDFSHGHDRSRPELNGWYSKLESGKGPCCDGPGVDAYTVEDPDWESKDGHYRVRIEGEWYDVPDNAVLKVPNLDGRTIVWPIRGLDGLTIRCFIPGSMT